MHGILLAVFDAGRFGLPLKREFLGFVESDPWRVMVFPYDKVEIAADEQPAVRIRIIGHIAMRKND